LAVIIRDPADDNGLVNASVRDVIHLLGLIIGVLMAGIEIRLSEHTRA